MRLSSDPMPRHEKFEELAALAVVGELNPLEWEYLEEHLATCSDCREAYEALMDVAWNDLGVSAAGREHADSTDSTPADDVATRESLKELRRRLQQRRLETLTATGRFAAQRFGDKGQGNHDSVFRLRRLAFGLAATVLLTAGIAAAVWLRSAKTISTERARSQELQATADALRKQNGDLQSNASTALTRSFDDAQKVRDVLQGALTASETRNADLVAREKDAEAKLTQAIADTERLKQELMAKDADRERVAQLQRDAEGRLHDALAQLYEARQSSPKITASNTSAEPSAAAGVEIAEDGTVPPYPNEVEARNLFGARNLHIVDVYDVMGDGKTRRTTGRVYYVDKQVLVFYAFDLQERQTHRRGVFQAWGYREANAGKALNLGLFAVDDSAVGRWVLTVNRPDVLSHIDAVFVTSEPAGGSASPRGKKVLYANLAWPANHP